MKPGDIVIFNHLSKTELKKIVSLQIHELGKKLSARKITITMASSMNEREFTIESGGQ
jgi:ATP-dependent Clp protease ATP-binding subunit ClpA